ncbi:hypothetical protein HY523_01050 [Candidatus Berkelbacteria bacterium]|nr:hypothetical protein [Candidatus Berkelbacteria bacterium]
MPQLLDSTMRFVSLRMQACLINLLLERWLYSIKQHEGGGMYNDQWEREGHGHRRSSQVRAMTLGAIGQGVNSSYLTPKSSRRKTTRVDQLLAEVLKAARSEEGPASPNMD